LPTWLERFKKKTGADRENNRKKKKKKKKEAQIGFIGTYLCAVVLPSLK
jgi:hypothetical protein